jgi:hypothetical protein
MASLSWGWRRPPAAILRPFPGETAGSVLATDVRLGKTLRDEAPPDTVTFTRRLDVQPALTLRSLSEDGRDTKLLLSGCLTIWRIFSGGNC